MNQRDLELLSAYLDGQLSPSDSARLEARLKTDRELVSILDELRATRTILRKLPQRRAPRNFTLTRKMVGLNPPMPRSYPTFRFATVVATLLFFFTFGVNTLAPQFLQAPAFGMGGGGGEPETFAQQAPVLESASAAATEAPVESPAADLAPQPTLFPPSEDTARVLETPTTKVGEEGQVRTDREADAPFIPSIWQTLFAVVAVVGAMLMALMRRSSINRWR